MPSCKLPAELCDQIIDELWDDLPALRAIGISNSSMLPKSRAHLFYSVKLTFSEDIGSFDSILATSSSRGNLIDVNLCVRELIVDGMFAPPQLSPRVDRTTVRILQRLSRVDSMALHSIAFAKGSSHSYAQVVLQEDTRMAFLNFAPELRKLTINTVYFKEFDHLRQFLFAFPMLTSLHLELVESEDSLPISAPSELLVAESIPSNLICITELGLVELGDPAIVERIWATIQNPPFQLDLRQYCISLEHEDISGVNPVAFCRRAGTNLETLEISCSWDAGETTGIIAGMMMARPENWLDLSENTNLTILRFRYNLWRFTDVDDQSWIVDIIASVRSPALRLVQFDLQYVSRDEAIAEIIRTFNPIDAALARLVETHPLLVVRFDVNAREPEEAASALIAIDREALEVIRGRMCQLRSKTKHVQGRCMDEDGLPTEDLWLSD